MVPRHNILFLVDDLNAKVCKDLRSGGRPWGSMGSKNSERLLELCVDNEHWLYNQYSFYPGLPKVHLDITKWKNKQFNRLCRNQRGIIIITVNLYSAFL